MDRSQESSIPDPFGGKVIVAAAGCVEDAYDGEELVQGGHRCVSARVMRRSPSRMPSRSARPPGRMSRTRMPPASATESAPKSAQACRKRRWLQLSLVDSELITVVVNNFEDLLDYSTDEDKSNRSCSQTVSSPG